MMMDEPIIELAIATAVMTVDFDIQNPIQFYIRFNRNIIISKNNL